MACREGESVDAPSHDRMQLHDGDCRRRYPSLAGIFSQPSGRHAERGDLRPRQRARMVLTMEGEPGPVRNSESYPNESGKRYLSLRRRVTKEVERIVVHDGLPGDERHSRAVPSHRSLR